MGGGCDVDASSESRRITVGRGDARFSFPVYAYSRHEVWGPDDDHKWTLVVWLKGGLGWRQMRFETREEANTVSDVVRAHIRLP